MSVGLNKVLSISIYINIDSNIRFAVTHMAQAHNLFRGLPESREPIVSRLNDLNGTASLNGVIDGI